jgi:hypothetical protein
LSWCQAPWDSRPFSLPELNHCGNSPYVTSSLTRRWVCLLWIFLAFSQVYISHLYHVIDKFYFLHYTQVLCQYRVPVKSKSHCDWRSVSRSVLVSYPIWGIWPAICFFILILRKLQSCLWGRPLWREVGSVVCQSVFCVMSLSVCIYSIITKLNI